MSDISITVPDGLDVSALQATLQSQADDLVAKQIASESTAIRQTILTNLPTLSVDELREFNVNLTTILNARPVPPS